MIDLSLNNLDPSRAATYLAAAASISTPSADLAAIEATFGDASQPLAEIGQTARRNPSLPLQMLRRRLFEGKLDAWANPATPLLLLDAAGAGWVVTGLRALVRDVDGGAANGRDSEVLAAAKANAQPGLDGFWATLDPFRQMERLNECCSTAWGEPAHHELVRVRSALVRPWLPLAGPDEADLRLCLDEADEWVERATTASAAYGAQTRVQRVLARAPHPHDLSWLNNTSMPRSRSRCTYDELRATLVARLVRYVLCDVTPASAKPMVDDLMRVQLDAETCLRHRFSDPFSAINRPAAMQPIAQRLSREIAALVPSFPWKSNKTGIDGHG